MWFWHKIRTVPFKAKCCLRQNNVKGTASQNMFCPRRPTFFQWVSGIKRRTLQKDFVLKCSVEFSFNVKSCLYQWHLGGLGVENGIKCPRWHDGYLQLLWSCSQLMWACNFCTQHQRGSAFKMGRLGYLPLLCTANPADSWWRIWFASKPIFLTPWAKMTMHCQNVCCIWCWYFCSRLNNLPGHMPVLLENQE